MDMIPNGLERSMIAFKLKDGNIIFISKEDCKEIGTKIIALSMLKNHNFVFKEKNKSIEKADRLYNILKEQEDLDPEVKKRYLTIIGNLLASDDIVYTTTDDIEVCLDKDTPKVEI